MWSCKITKVQLTFGVTSNVCNELVFSAWIWGLAFVVLVSAGQESEPVDALLQAVELVLVLGIRAVHSTKQCSGIAFGIGRQTIEWLGVESGRPERLSWLPMKKADVVKRPAHFQANTIVNPRRSCTTLGTGTLMYRHSTSREDSQSS